MGAPQPRRAERVHDQPDDQPEDRPGKGPPKWIFPLAVGPALHALAGSRLTNRLGDRLPDDPGGRAPDRRHLGFVGTILQIDRLDLPEAQWGRRVVEPHRDQAATIASVHRLIQHPVGRHRCGGPYDNHRIRRIQFALDLGREMVPALQRCVPPDGVSGPGQRLRQPLHRRPVDPGIGDEEPEALRRCRKGSRCHAILLAQEGLPSTASRLARSANPRYG